MYNIFSSVINDDFVADNHDSAISDHHAQFLILPNYTITQNSRTTSANKIFSVLFLNNLSTSLKKVNWDNTLNIFDGNVNKIFQNLFHKVRYT